MLLILQIGHGMLQGLCTTYVQGVAGAGKTYLNSLLAIVLVELCDIRVLWTGEMNQPQFEGAKELARFLPENNLQQKRYIRLPAKHLPGNCPLDIPFAQRQLHLGRLARAELPRCVLITGGCLEVDVCKKRYGVIKPVLARIGISVVLVDEAQTYGHSVDGVIASFLEPSAMVVLQGDRYQPVGGKDVAEATELDPLPDLQSRSPGIRAEVNYVRPAAHLLALAEAMTNIRRESAVR